MVADLKRPRPDLIYMRRRLKVGEKLPTVSTSSAVSLSLATEPEEPKETPLPEAPYVKNPTLLGETNPVVRLNKRQSAVGSLVIANVHSVGWQLKDGTTGFLYRSGHAGVNEPTHVLPKMVKNRPLVEFHKDLLVVSLRNLKSLKRFIVTPEPGQELQLATISDISITMPYKPNRCLYGSNVKSHLELRVEEYRNSVHETFRVGTFNSPAPTVSAHNTQHASNMLQSVFISVRGH